MAERRQFLDRLTPDVRAHVRQIGGDPDVVDFLLGWYGLLRMDPSVTEMASLKTKIWPYWSTTRQRQVKRELKERYGPAWKTKWEDIQASARSYEPPKFKGGLFSIDPQGPNPAHGPFAGISGWPSGTPRIISRRIHEETPLESDRGGVLPDASIRLCSGRVGETESTFRKARP